MPIVHVNSLSQYTVRPKKHVYDLCCVLAERRSGLQRFAMFGSRVGLSSPVFERHLFMMTSSNGNIFRVTGHLPVNGEFPAQMPVTRSFDCFFDLRLNKRLSKQWWGWWFETPSRPLRRNCNERAATQNNGPGVRVTPSRFFRLVILSVICFRIISKSWPLIWYYVHICQVSLQLSCSNICHILTWFREYNRYICTGESRNKSFSSRHYCASF